MTGSDAKRPSLHALRVLTRNSAAVQIYHVMNCTSHVILARGLILVLENFLQDGCLETAMKLQKSF